VHLTSIPGHTLDEEIPFVFIEAITVKKYRPRKGSIIVLEEEQSPYFPIS